MSVGKSKAANRKKVTVRKKSLFIPFFIVLLLVFFVIQNSSYGQYIMQGAGPETPVPTVYILSPTPTQSPRELLINRSFEKRGQNSEAPDFWEHDGRYGLFSGRQDCTTANSGNCSVRMDGSTGSVIRQYHAVSPASTGKVILSGWSKAWNLYGKNEDPGRSSGLRAVLHHTDGTVDHTLAVGLEEGTYDWQKTRMVMHVRKPLKAVEIVCEHEKDGTVWFDDVSFVIE